MVSIFLTKKTMFLPSIFLLISIRDIVTANSFDTQGPTFIIEPPTKLDFTNTAGARADCVSRGNPTPNVEWLDADNNVVITITKVRHILANGSLYFPPFEAGSFRQDVHWASYKCSATNSVGTIISRDLSVKGVVNQRYDPEVQNPGSFIGSNVIMKCYIPSFVKDYVTVTSWLQEPSFNIYPSLESDGKYHMLPTGELIINNISRSDSQRTYRCRTHHQLTQEAVVSGNVGRIQLTEMREHVPPIINEKLIQITVKLDDVLIVPCVAYASPHPVYRWHRRNNDRDEPLENNPMNNRISVHYGTLTITSMKKSDAGTYFCTATNSEGSETLEVQVAVTSPLTSHIQPPRQTVDLGKSSELVCTITGFPRSTITWLKDGHPLRIGSRVRLLSKEHIKITSVTKEDRGMYQCFVKNEHDAVQATAEMKLGEVAPQLAYKFIEQTMQPGPSVSLKCSASGNPTPQITWNLDGFPLPNNDRLLIGQYVTVFGDVISHVNISAVKSEDGGEYECIAKSRAGMVSHSGRLNIYGMPYVRPMSSISAVAGKSLTIKCPVAGYPIDSITWEKVPPKITPFGFARDLNVGDRTSIQCVVGTGDLPLTFTWLKDKKPIITSESGKDSNNGDYGNSWNIGVGDTMSGTGNGGKISNASITIRQYDDFTSSLSITSVTRSQGGTYTCKVQNDAATVEHSAQLRVNVPPRISPFSFEDDITEGMRTQLMCSSSQGDQPFNITWLKDTKPIDVDKDSTININEYAPFSSILTIHNLTSRHNGNYTCEISNRGGSVKYTAILSVAVPPRWLVEPQDQSAILGNNVLIRCNADGFPIPTIHWKQAIGEQSGEYRELNYGNGNFAVESHPNGSLIIAKVSQEHEGYFLCQASNGIGAGLSKLIRLTVHVGPTVIVRNKQVSVRRGDRVTLRCEADGDQPLDVSWRAKGNRIDPTYDIRYHLKNSPLTKGVVSELTIVQSTLNDRGEYSCVATNAYGHDHAALHLQVQEPPNFPKNLHATELSSRSVVLEWMPNEQDIPGSYGDSQPISNYILQFKEAQDVWHDHNNQKLLPGDKTTAIISSLKPATNYHFRLFAENHLGTSAPSDILQLQTDAEVPGGPPLSVTVEPLSAQQLLVTWRPPERDLWNGELLGYTIGYQKHSSSDQSYNYTRVGIPGGEGVSDFRLIGLDKYTQYSITIQAFNSKGDGPPSEPSIAHTLEDVPSAPPQDVTCSALTSQNIQVTWQAPPKLNMHGIIQGYKLLYEPSNLEVEYVSRETKITSSLNTVLHGLQPYTNYSVQVLAFTRAGEGISSPITSCITEETVPDAPERIKSVVNSETSVMISWLPPRRPNGIVTKYIVYIRILDKGQEVKIIKDMLLAQNHHYEARDLNSRESYEAWVTASTRVGQGPSTPVIKLTPSSIVPAAIISFGQTLSVAWRVDVKLACLFVGNPTPQAEWKSIDARSGKHRLEVGNDNTLTLRNVQRQNEGNYSCHVRNAQGSDHITYQLFIQVPPDAPKLSIPSVTSNSVSLEWQIRNSGGAPIRGFVLSYRPEFGEWEEIQIDRRTTSYLLENLQCGTRYQFTLTAFNKIGNGAASKIENSRTKGNKPISPQRQQLLRPNVTSISLDLTSWQDGGCQILYFTVEFRRYGSSSDWIIVSSNITPLARFIIPDLESATAYNVRVTAHNNAGTTIAEYYIETLNLMGTISNLETSENSDTSVKSLLMDSQITIVLLISIFCVVLTLVSVCFCFRFYSNALFNRNNPVHHQNHPNEAKHSIPEHHDQYYTAARKQISQSPCQDQSSALERIPEYSEDIYPYATFHLPDQENLSGNPSRHGVYDSRDMMSATKQIRSNSSSVQNIGTAKRTRRKSKAHKSESEEYDSLGSDTESGSGEHGASSRTESSNQLDEPVNFTNRAHSPGIRPGKEKMALFTRSTLHKPQYNNQKLSTSTENLQTSKVNYSNGPVHERSPSGRHSADISINYNEFNKLQKQLQSSLQYSELSTNPSNPYQNSRSNSQTTLYPLNSINGNKSIIQSNNPINHYHQHQTEVQLNARQNISAKWMKSYGDFLTITPRRKGRTVTANLLGGYGEQWTTARLQEQQNGAVTLELDQLSLSQMHKTGFQQSTLQDSVNKSLVANDYYFTNSSIGNEETLPMGSNFLSYKNKYMFQSSGSLKHTNNYHPVGQDSVFQKLAISQMTDNEKMQSIIAYANVSPPSAFSDISKYSSAAVNIIKDDRNGNNNNSGKSTNSLSNSHKLRQKDYTIAV